MSKKYEPQRSERETELLKAIAEEHAKSPADDYKVFELLKQLYVESYGVEPIWQPPILTEEENEIAAAVLADIREERLREKNEREKNEREKNELSAENENLKDHKDE